jgi:thioredoxin reductase (NADPH)
MAARASNWMFCTLRWDARSARNLAIALGAECTEQGNLKVNAHQQTTVECLYAAGDVVSDLHQLAVATGHAAIAATDIHNRLNRNPR